MSPSESRLHVSLPMEESQSSGIAPAAENDLRRFSIEGFMKLVRDRKQLTPAARSGLPWLWQGYLAPGKVTLLTSQWKAGKTTLVSVLLARMQKGGQLAGLKVAPANVLVVSEESSADWDARCTRLGLENHVSFVCRPFRAKPSEEEWLMLVEGIETVCRQKDITLVVIDPLASFLPGRDENVAGAMLDRLLALDRLRDAGRSVLLLHHPRKGKIVAGQAARGSSALSGYADILIEMNWFRTAADIDRRRRLTAYSRETETLRGLVIELTEDGTDYICHGEATDGEFADTWNLVVQVLQDAQEKLTRKQIAEEWPEDYPVPDRGSLWRILERAAARGLVCREGEGRKTMPFRYWLPGKEADFCPGPGATPQEMLEWNNRTVARHFLKQGIDIFAPVAASMSKAPEERSLVKLTTEPVADAPATSSPVEAEPNPAVPDLPAKKPPQETPELTMPAAASRVPVVPKLPVKKRPKKAPPASTTGTATTPAIVPQSSEMKPPEEVQLSSKAAAVDKPRDLRIERAGFYPYPPLPAAEAPETPPPAEPKPRDLAVERAGFYPYPPLPKK